MDKLPQMASLRERLRDTSFRSEISLYLGCGFNWLFGMFRIFTSLVYASPWDGAIAIYYIVLGMMRLILIQNRREADKIVTEREKRLYEYYGYRQCGFMMFMLNICATGIIVQIIRHNEGYAYPRSIIGIYAIYALVMLNLAFINLVRYRKCHSPNVSAAKVVSFSMALMAILSLQTAMIAQFGTDCERASELNISLSCLICITLFGMAIYMIRGANQAIHRLKQSMQVQEVWTEPALPPPEPVGSLCRTGAGPSKE